MTYRKRLQELTIKDNFMFGAVMSDAENCRALLEMVLEIPIARVEVSREKSIVYHPEYKGVRLDVYAKDERNTQYNVEMQMVQKPALPRRARYYHSQIDMELLLSGTSYSQLPDSYVIFICDFDPFGKKRYRYSFENRCQEEMEFALGDGSRTVFLSTVGENADEVPESMVKFLEFVRADAEECSRDFGDSLVKRLQDTVQYVKASREMEERFMIFEEMLQDERAAGIAEGTVKAVLMFLEELGEVPEALRQKIMEEKDPDVLQTYLKKAARADSIEQFCSEI